MTLHRSTRLPFFVHRCVRSAQQVLTRAGVRDEAVIVGVSGGSDSMALLEIVGLLSSKLRLELHVVCVDHGLRPEAAAETELVRRAAERWNARFHPVRLTPGRADEDSLRKARHAALEQVRLQVQCRFILLGHTRDDQIETIVFRFLRGAGFGGLSGMSEARAALLRPLLATPRAELRRLLESRAVEWADDATNETDRYARGRLRTSVFPAIAAAFGAGALDHLLDVAPRWRADEDFLESETARLLAYASRRGPGGTDLDVEALGWAHPALRARALRRWLLEATGRMPGSRDIAAIERWLDRGSARRGHLDLAGLRLGGSAGRLSVELRTDLSSSMTPGDIDIASSSDDPHAAHSADGAREDDDRGKAVLPPSDGRVRFPRK